MARTLEFGIQNGFVETVGGRRRYMPELSSNNHFLKAAGERAAINHPIQGTSADMIKIAMVAIGKELGANDNCKLILQVHDELMFECDPKDVEKHAKMIKQKMESALKLSVPVKVDLKSGKSWGEMTPIDV